MSAKSGISVMCRVFQLHDAQRTGLCDVGGFEKRQLVTEAKFITKSSLFIQ